MVRIAATCLALATLAGPALACINDSELPSHEREFRSQYARKATRGAGAIARPFDRWPLIGGGAALLVVAAGLALVGERARG